MNSEDAASREADSNSPPPSGVRTSLKNIGVLLVLILAIVSALGLVVALGSLADKHVDKVQMRLKSQRENRQPPDAISLPLTPSTQGLRP
jgi:hypothetical protein